MKLATGPRPRSVQFFALAFIAIGLWNLVDGLSDIEASGTALGSVLAADFSRDTVIVVLLARFTIVLIPVIAVWVFASKVARVLVTIMVLAALPQLWLQFEAFRIGFGVDKLVITSVLGGLIGVANLYTRAANAWFKTKGRGVVETFE